MKNLQLTIIRTSSYAAAADSHIFSMAQNNPSTTMGISEIRDAVLNFDQDVRSGIETGDIRNTMRRIARPLVSPAGPSLGIN